MRILRFREPAADGPEHGSAAVPGFAFVEVADSAGFASEINRGGYDAILINFIALPANRPSPAELARLHAPDVPIVYLVDEQDEAEAIAAVNEGLADYVLSSHPQRLGSVLQRVCREGAESRQRRRQLEACEAKAHHYQQLFQDAPCALLLVDAMTRQVIEVNQAAVDFYGYTPNDFGALTTTHLEAGGEIPATQANPARQRHRRQDGRVIEVELITTQQMLTGRPVELILVKDDTVRRLSEEQSERLKADWEKRARQRTASLEVALKELEAFSYSVSHDLRAPLRGIDGFARALLEDCGANLGVEGVRLIQVIRQETKRMAQLIDDLLAFSRAGRQQIDPSEIDMTELARSAFQNIVEALPGTPPLFELQELPAARGDRSMLRQVFANLLENAVKFSARKSAPRIELSGWSESNQQVFRVKDNGVGFDPRYAHKLFAVFQRLHRQEEFAGTGVGLALVQRIVQRHGGRVWAESTLHDGASFYFALPSQLRREPAPPEPLPVN